ncbi:MAG: hypothetical protein ACFFCZ_24855 [Promethearchaeota archaeon]
MRQGVVATEDITNFIERLKAVNNWVGERSKVALFVSSSPITEKGDLILWHFCTKSDYSLVKCISTY